MSISVEELAAESAELLPGREALGKLKFNWGKSFNLSKHVDITKNIANVHATNLSTALNIGSYGADAESAAAQSITITQ